jgi:hypothetical protein
MLVVGIRGSQEKQQKQQKQQTIFQRSAEQLFVPESGNPGLHRPPTKIGHILCLTKPWLPLFG